MKPIYALHTDDNGKVLSAGSFDYSFKLNDWLKALDIQAGDKVEFQELHVRREVEEAPPLTVVTA